jgi:N6-adenosine-specific RNA methylase IME4
MTGEAVQDLQFHPLANLFPLIEGRDFDELVADVHQHGLREPVVLHEGMILDGRNRYRACKAAEMPPRFETFTGSDPVAYVISINLRRRHLSEAQRGMVAAAVANLRDGQRADLAARSANLRTLPGVAQPSPPISTAKAAELLNVSARTVEAAQSVLKHGTPELADKVRAGAVSVSAAADVARLPELEQRDIVAKGEREILEAAKRIRAEKAERRAVELAAQKAAIAQLPAPTGRYDVLILDPPWPMEKIERDVRPNQVAFEYPTMTEEELTDFPVAAIAAESAHLFCWTTHKFLPMALRLIERWGFRYCLTMVWHKPGGFQPIGLPQYNCEFAIYARRGSPQFIQTKAFPACFHAPRREHSRKPDEFYDLIRRVTDGTRIELFSREPRDGFDQYGDEADKFAGAA